MDSFCHHLPGSGDLDDCRSRLARHDSKISGCKNVQRMCKEWQTVYRQLNVIDDQDERFEYFKIAVEKVNINLSPEGVKLITGTLSWGTEPSLSRDRKKAVEEIMRPVMLRSLEKKNEH